MENKLSDKASKSDIDEHCDVGSYIHGMDTPHSPHFIGPKMSEEMRMRIRREKGYVVPEQYLRDFEHPPALPIPWVKTTLELILDFLKGEKQSLSSSSRKPEENEPSGEPEEKAEYESSWESEEEYEEPEDFVPDEPDEHQAEEEEEYEEEEYEEYEKEYEEEEEEYEDEEEPVQS